MRKSIIEKFIANREKYSGSLSLNEYVVFIQNSACARCCGVDIPSIDWQKVKEGITSKLEEMISSDEDKEALTVYSNRTIVGGNSNNMLAVHQNFRR
ncbi:MAG: hypothetical protein LUH18_02630 [Oscillospiraceae bacterium]|nr:hypothetical protein [Oscillospiraceae bacterium]